VGNNQDKSLTLKEDVGMLEDLESFMNRISPFGQPVKVRYIPAGSRLYIK
jgi:hypothetical protein